MKMEKLEMGVICHVTVNVGITFWQAVKLRIAGKAYLPIAERIGDEIVRGLKIPPITNTTE